jgi:CheY-like chemotaxis protein
MLRDLSYGVLEASNGPQGLSLLERHPEICMLLTDVGLPNGMNGRQLAERALAQCPNLKLPFITRYARNEPRR